MGADENYTQRLLYFAILNFVIKILLKLFFNEQYSTRHTESPDGYHLGYDGGVVYIPSPHPRAGVPHVRE